MRKLMGKHTAEAFQPLCSCFLPYHVYLFAFSILVFHQLNDHESHSNWLESQIAGLQYLNCHWSRFPKLLVLTFSSSRHFFLLSPSQISSLELLECNNDSKPVFIFLLIGDPIPLLAPPRYIHLRRCFFLTLRFFSFHPGRTVSILCRGAVWRNCGSRHQRRETSENLCSQSWSEWLPLHCGRVATSVCKSNHKLVNFGKLFLCQFSPNTWKLLHGAF